MVSETGMLSSGGGSDANFALMYARVSRFMSWIAAIVISCVGSIGLSDLRHTELRLGASVGILVDSVDGADADELADILFGQAADPDAYELAEMPL